MLLPDVEQVACIRPTKRKKTPLNGLPWYELYWHVPKASPSIHAGEELRNRRGSKNYFLPKPHLFLCIARNCANIGIVLETVDFGCVNAHQQQEEGAASLQKRVTFPYHLPPLPPELLPPPKLGPLEALLPKL
mmetsp:Transcript_6136/g.8928  ORF Transcript_6136/g.8928 Transcript_6136/m.8928 type:complete len:133 (-) Transcript_6136:1525-1923(-)